MNFRIKQLGAALALLGASAQSGMAGGMATEPKTWSVYCEGAGPEGHWAVFSDNTWPHPETADYGRRVGSAAKAFFEARHDLALDGCAGVNFRDGSLAEHSRTLTVQLHRRMGDRILFLPLPAEALPADAPPASVVAAAIPAGGDVGQVVVGAGENLEQRRAPLPAPR